MIESKRGSQLENPELPVDSIGMFRGSLQSDASMTEELMEEHREEVERDSCKRIPIALHVNGPNIQLNVNVRKRLYRLPT